MTMQRQGPLVGVKILEVAGVGPGPFAGMMLADMGADIIRVERAGAPAYVPPIDPALNLLHRGRRTITLDLKNPAAVETLLKLAEKADVLMEGFRPGVTERLGIGPEVCLARNPKLIYARMTGWGQDGPLADLGGHDINYFAMSGALWLCGRKDEAPGPNVNFVADMGGGGMLMAFGIACAIVEARASGQGQVIDAAMMEGTALLSTMIHGNRAMGRWTDERGVNLLDSGAPFYDVYETKDGGYFAVGAIEGKFYADLVKGLGVDTARFPKQHDRQAWPAMRDHFKELFAGRTRAEWEEVFAPLDACASPVLTPDEAAEHPHARARESFGRPNGVLQPMPAPKFSRTPGAIAAPPPADDAGGPGAMREWGLSDADFAGTLSPANG